MSNERVDRMLTHMRAFQKIPGRHDEGAKGREYAQFESAWKEATVPERQEYQSTIHREIRERAAVRQAATRERAAERKPAAVTDLADRRRQSRQQPRAGRESR